jgi:hypothetical protein
MIRSTKRGGTGVVLAALMVAAACGGSVNPGVASGGGNGADAGGGADAAGGGMEAAPAVDGAKPVDGAMGDESTAAMTYDGTTGKPCQSSSDCASANGPQLARCSNEVFAPQAYYPQAVCILVTCSPVSDTTAHFCDGPDDPSSPGICVPQSTGGICLPRCTFDKSGGAPSGCTGKDACFPYVAAPAEGVGYCWGGCTASADCPSGQQCQTNEGLCMEGLVPPTKAYGASCSKADSEDGACNCLYGGTNDDGYCSNFCLVGGAAGCPAGSVCDALEYRQDGFTTQNPGLAGYCAIACSTADAGTTCPTATTCTDIFAAGPDCVP